MQLEVCIHQKIVFEAWHGVIFFGKPINPMTKPNEVRSTTLHFPVRIIIIASAFDTGKAITVLVVLLRCHGDVEVLYV